MAKVAATPAFLGWLKDQMSEADRKTLLFQANTDPNKINDPNALGFVVIPDNIQSKYSRLIDQATTIKPAEAAKPALLAYAANRRWAIETGGVSVPSLGLVVDTSDRGKTMILGAVVTAQSDPAFTTIWIDKNGLSKELTAEQIVDLSNTVTTFVAGVFSKYDQISKDISSGTITTNDQIDQAFSA